MKTSFVFEVPGKPKQWSRARRNGNRYFKASEDVSAQNAIRSAYVQTPGSRIIDGPVRLSVLVLIASSKKSKILEPKDTRPDADNYIKQAMDALNGAAYHDDGQVADARVRKFYVDKENEGMVIRIDEMPSEDFEKIIEEFKR